MQSLPPRPARMLTRYVTAIVLPLVAIFVAVELALPAFIFEHVMVLLVVALAITGGRGPAVLVAVTGSVGDNLLLRAPIGQPAIDGFRDVVDFALFLIVAAAVGWLVSRLREAKERALLAAERERAAREERDRVVATVTHDLATPLSAIQGTIQYAMKNDTLSAVDVSRLLGRIETAAARATALIRTLNDARSLDHDELSLDLDRVDLRSVVEPIVRMLEPASDRHQIVLEVPPAPLWVDCDRQRIGRVVENLITNAIKYSPDGGPVHVSAAEESGWIVLRVADHGIGVHEAERERLFEHGYRSDKAADVAPGLGLGLYIASAIVRRHGGALEASPGKTAGSVFTVRLPPAAPAPNEPRPGHLQQSPSHQGTSR